MKTAIFLGAGASSEDGAPLQSEIFNKYFTGLRKDGYPRGEDEERALIKYFQKMFGIDVTACDSSTIFPTFEEAMGILDLAVIRNEIYKGFTNQETRSLREYLVKLMTRVIGDELGEPWQPEELNDLNEPDEFNKPNDPNKSEEPNEPSESQKTQKLNKSQKPNEPKLLKDHHKQLVHNLMMKDKLRETVFVSTNYDILIDNALALHSEEFDLDYGIDFVNVTDRNTDINTDKYTGKKRLQPEQSVKLYKFHGSLNWLYCPACNTIELTPFEEAAARSTICHLCGSEFSTLIVPPTYFKSLTNVYLGMVWIKAELALRKVQHLIFCGYSFTDVDMHIKYLIKRVQNYREKDLLITVINNYNGKTDESKEAEKNRFQRFLSKRVDYTDICFGEFASDPLSCWK
jgi:hypothetical protein